MNEADFERILDARIMARLATDRAYRNAENADEQKGREDAIEAEEYDRLVAEEQHAQMTARTIEEDRRPS